MVDCAATLLLSQGGRSSLLLPPLAPTPSRDGFRADREVIDDNRRETVGQVNGERRKRKRMEKGSGRERAMEESTRSGNERAE